MSNEPKLIQFNGHAMTGCDFPGCPSRATLILAFTCGHHLCKTHEYFWTPECPACAQGVARRQTEVEAIERARAIFGPKEPARCAPGSGTGGGG